MKKEIKEFIELMAWAWEYNRASFFLMLSLLFDFAWIIALLIMAIRH